MHSRLNLAINDCMSKETGEMSSMHGQVQEGLL